MNKQLVVIFIILLILLNLMLFQIVDMTSRIEIIEENIQNNMIDRW